jgi:hypothetical protein
MVFEIEKRNDQGDQHGRERLSEGGLSQNERFVVAERSLEGQRAPLEVLLRALLKAVNTSATQPQHRAGNRRQSKFRIRPFIHWGCLEEL